MGTAWSRAGWGGSQAKDSDRLEWWQRQRLGPAGVVAALKARTGWSGGSAKDSDRLEWWQRRKDPSRVAPA
ncbi:hypothetical protein GCM10022236_30180 [Microlunatus ginsengisoli]|uniref:Uncharacterized protein n=1 Tax=Microlunatus ginsengisoli TaxID=363863 RepID=A0ABP7A6E0_9ACTN